VEKFSPVVKKLFQERNELADKYQDEIDKSLRGYVIPSRNQGFLQYKESEAPLYECRREWVDIDKLYSGFKDGYERLVNDFFWNIHNTENKKLLVILGEGGIGKSTFIQHYLRCYCPEKKPNKHSFEKKLIIYFDGKPCSSEELFEGYFLDSINSQLKTHNLPEPNGNSSTVLTIIQSFRILSKYAISNDKHLVVCLDNIDQCPFEIQSHASSIIHKLIEDSEGINIWKIIFPLWPETFYKLKTREKFYIRGSKFKEIKLGYVNSKKMILRRVNNISKFNDDVIDLKAKKYFSRIRKVSYETIHNLASCDNKLILKMIGDLLSSKNFYYYQDNKPKKTSLMQYEFEDILICGQYNYHHNENIIINFFNILGNSETQFHSSILLGGIILNILKESGGEVNKSDFLSTLLSYGYTTVDINSSLSKIKMKKIIHYEDKEENTIIVHVDSINEYLNFIKRAAYIDNMALVTPIPLVYKSDMHETKGYMKTDFKRRVETSIQFIKYLHKAELKLQQDYPQSDRSQYSIWEELRDNYCSRLVTLRYDKRYLKTVARKKDSWWDKILSDDLFAKCPCKV